VSSVGFVGQGLDAGQVLRDRDAAVVVIGVSQTNSVDGVGTDKHDLDHPVTAPLTLRLGVGNERCGAVIFEVPLLEEPALRMVEDEQVVLDLVDVPPPLRIMWWPSSTSS